MGHIFHIRKKVACAHLGTVQMAVVVAEVVQLPWVSQLWEVASLKI